MHNTGLLQHFKVNDNYLTCGDSLYFYHVGDEGLQWFIRL